MVQNDAAGEVTFRHVFQSGLAQKTGWGNPPDSTPPNDIDPLHQCFHEVMPTTIDAMDSKFYVQDNSETPDTMLATFLYQKFLASYENRTCNPLPMSEIETCVRSSAVCILANVAMRSKVRLDWDEDNWTVAQDAARPTLKEKYRAPWKLEV
jgi:hypothetical protein